MVMVCTGLGGSLSAGRKHGDQPVFSWEALKGVPRQASWLQATDSASSGQSLEFSEVNSGVLVLTRSDLALSSVKDPLADSALGRTSGSGTHVGLGGWSGDRRS